MTVSEAKKYFNTTPYAKHVGMIAKIPMASAAMAQDEPHCVFSI
jgi:hypothetical protein